MIPKAHINSFPLQRSTCKFSVQIFWLSENFQQRTDIKLCTRCRGSTGPFTAAKLGLQSRNMAGRVFPAELEVISTGNGLGWTGEGCREGLICVPR